MKNHYLSILTQYLPYGLNFCFIPPSGSDKSPVVNTLLSIDFVGNNLAFDTTEKEYLQWEAKPSCRFYYLSKALMMPQQTFTRKEVRQLLQKQIKACCNSLDKSPINMALARGFQAKEYGEELDANAKRLRNVNVIKF